MHLPAPRLQLRWREPTDKERQSGSIGLANDYGWACDYELVLPLGEFDVRRESHGKEQVLKIGTTLTSTSRAKVIDYAPFRDGAHAQWDSKSLGGIPVYVIATDGTPHLQPQKQSDAA